jgi:hypothetical protein
MRSDASTSAAVAHFWHLGLAVVILAFGCASEGSIKNMREVPIPNAALTPQEGKALIVFVRPSDPLSAVQASLFRLTIGDPELVGILAAKTVVAYQTEPGTHLFMSVVFGGKTEFMTADLRADKTYYVMVKALVVGFGNNRCYLTPVERAGTTRENLQGLLKNSRQVEKTFESEDWVRKNMADIRARASSYNQSNSTPRLQQDDGW